MQEVLNHVVTVPNTVAMEKTRDHASGSRQVVVFGLGEERYATDVTRVQEIIRWTEPALGVVEPARRAQGSSTCAGEGSASPSATSRRASAPPSSAPDEDSKIVVVETAAGVCGLIGADKVHEVRTLDEVELGQGPGARLPGGLRGRHREGGRSADRAARAGSALRRRARYRRPRALAA